MTAKHAYTFIVVTVQCLQYVPYSLRSLKYVWMGYQNKPQTPKILPLRDRRPQVLKILDPKLMIAKCQERTQALVSYMGYLLLVRVAHVWNKCLLERTITFSLSLSYDRLKLTVYIKNFFGTHSYTSSYLSHMKYYLLVLVIITKLMQVW